jgi:hypothetical protein
VAYRKGELSPAAIDRGWPHQVALRSDLVVRDFHQILAFCEGRSLCPRGHSVNDGQDWYRVYCFAELEDAERFIAKWGGERFNPVDRGREKNWAMWKR